ncbi:ATP-binding cassette domain-containing protein [Vagococcus elongatus]|uniref:ABC transporter ATP-binding protein n=1 Tax=Vagococcus elongatus TaxID=180344 RepID=A0A430AX42_9ENTE|nr:ABC transporter ATP-binding protein [Vagococcus elongatus]RSU12632.1 ABC transporter ATP-binding protein [Vagococcus elongatus]
MTTILEVSHVSKSFGSQQVLKNIEMEVKEGTVLGFIGKNGAGKTTLMKCIVGMLPIDSGEIRLANVPVTFRKNRTNQFIGYLPDVPAFYDEMTAVQYLKFCGDITGMSASKLSNKISEMLALVELESSNKSIGSYSRGMKQRLGIAQALLNEPKLLICDEPTSALDPVGRKEILELLRRVKNQTTVLFSTHILSDVEKICDDMMLLHEGKIISGTEIEKLKASHKKKQVLLELMNSSDREKFTEFDYQNHPAEKNDTSLIFQGEDALQLQQALFQFLAVKQIPVKKLMILEPSLEDLFQEVVK